MKGLVSVSLAAFFWNAHMTIPAGICLVVGALAYYAQKRIKLTVKRQDQLVRLAIYLLITGITAIIWTAVYAIFVKGLFI